MLAIHVALRLCTSLMKKTQASRGLNRSQLTRETGLKIENVGKNASHKIGIGTMNRVANHET